MKNTIKIIIAFLTCLFGRQVFNFQPARLRGLLTIILFAGGFSIINAQIGINEDGSNPDASAMLDVKSSDKGMLVPRMTEDERDAISNPATGLMIFNTTDSCFNYYTGTEWFKNCGRSLTADGTTLDGQDIGGTGADEGISINIDSDGNRIVSGYFENSMTIGGTTLTSAGDKDGFIAKFDSDYNLLWVEQVGNTNEDKYIKSVIDTDNNIYVFATFYGSLTIGSTTLTAAGTRDAFIAKYNSSGTLQWAIQTGCDNNMATESITIDEDDNLYVTGIFTGNATLGSSLSSSVGDIYLAKCDKNGNWSWAVQTTSTDGAYAYDVAVKNGNVFLGGEIYGSSTTTFGTTTLSANDYGFLAKYDTSGTFQWVKEIEGDNADVYGVTIDSNDDVIITGYSNAGSGTIVFGSTTVNISNTALFLAKYSSAGNVEWAIAEESSSSVEGWKVKTNTTNDIFVSGGFVGSTTFGSTTVTSNGIRDIFLAKYDTDGNFTWVTSGGGTDHDYPNDFVINTDGVLHLTGHFSSTATFDDQTFTSSGDKDVLLLQYNSDDGSQNSYTNSLSASQDGDSDASNEIQDISLSGTTLTISNGSSVDLSGIDTDTNTDDQTIDILALSGNVLNISLEDDGVGNNTLDLSGITTRALADADADTKIQVEKSTDEDIIRFDLNGTEHFTFHEGRIQFLNAGTSIAIGENAGINDNFSSTSRNVFIGYETGNTNTTGSNNMAIGMQALYTNNGSDNTAIGYQALYNNTTGEGNLALGTGAGLRNQQGNNNVLLGTDAGLGSSLHDKNNNVMIGFGAGESNEGDGNVFLGYNAGANESGSNRLYIDNSNTNTPLIFGEFDNNRVVINGSDGDNSNNRTLFVNGSIGATSAFNNDSDRRLKTNIQTIPNALDKVLQMRGVTYEWKDGREAGDRMGFIAQEVEPILPQVVDNKNDHYTMQYAPITAVLIEAVKEQQAQIEALKNENEQLKTQISKINQLEQQNAEMKAMLEQIQAQLNTQN